MRKQAHICVPLLSCILKLRALPQRLVEAKKSVMPTVSHFNAFAASQTHHSCVQRQVKLKFWQCMAKTTSCPVLFVHLRLTCRSMVSVTSGIGKDVGGKHE
eukprot:1136362-Pelagomonas_calceolata.AAC.5